jgi:hypothetical protein
MEVVGAMEPSVVAVGGEVAGGPPRLQSSVGCGSAGQDQRTGVFIGCVRRCGRDSRSMGRGGLRARR